MIPSGHRRLHCLRCTRLQSPIWALPRIDFIVSVQHVLRSTTMLAGPSRSQTPTGRPRTWLSFLARRGLLYRTPIALHCLIATMPMNKDSIERSAPGTLGHNQGCNRAEPQCYQGLNEPVAPPLSFAFGVSRDLESLGRWDFSGWEALVAATGRSGLLSGVVESWGAGPVGGATEAASGHRAEPGVQRVAHSPLDCLAGVRDKRWTGDFHGQRGGGARGSWPMRAMGFLQHGHTGTGEGGGRMSGEGCQSSRARMRCHRTLAAALSQPNSARAGSPRQHVLQETTNESSGGKALKCSLAVHYPCM